jgi:uncharacterized Ntn-hydrolase superfamily protein
MEPRPATFSIVARDPETDAVGVAVQSKFVSVGSVVPFASADAGAIATQSFANVAYGSDGLALLREGKSAEEVVTELTDDDPEAAQRQVGVVGQDGSVAAFTGAECFEFAGDLQGETYTVQGNILENRDTIEAMADTYETTDGGLPEKLIAALHAGNDAGGDERGEQSAALYVVKPEGGYDGKNDRWIDVRVDDHEDPIDELERAFKIYDVTLLEREEPDEVRELAGETAAAVTATLAELGFYSAEPTEAFGERERDALAEFRGMNNFENHDLAVVEDALARGWDAVEHGSTSNRNSDGSDDDAEGTAEDRMVDAIWHGLSRLDRR